MKFGLLQNPYNAVHRTLSMLLHYLRKLELVSQKVLLFKLNLNVPIFH